MAPDSHASTPPRSSTELAAAVEARAARSDFAQLNRFGDEALGMQNREGLNRLYHVAWTYLNQGDFESAILWSDRLSARAAQQGDTRYVTVASLNTLNIQSLEGDADAASEVALIARTETDWFAKVHASRLDALRQINEGRVGEALKQLADAEALIPTDAAYATTAHAGVWEIVGIALMTLNDVTGASTAFGRFEIDYSNPGYPRPDFDSIFNLATLAVMTGNQPLAEALYASHHRLSMRSGLPSLMAYDAALCSEVASAAYDFRRVLKCTERYGPGLGEAGFLASRILPVRAIAQARTGQISAARRDLATLRSGEITTGHQEGGQAIVDRAEAEILFAEGRTTEAFEKLRSWNDRVTIENAKAFSAGIGQVTGDMQEQLDERRNQLQTEQSNARLQENVIASQSWLFGIAVLFVLTAAAVLLWQFRQSQHLRDARRKAEAANRSKSEFLANMSHEIRTPLNGIVAMADTLARSDLAPREHEMVEVVRSSGMTLERLLSDILDLARIESGQITIEKTAFDLGHAVRGIAMLWQSRADEKGVVLNVAVDPAIDHFVDGDPVRVRQILTNLVSNALKFTEAGSVSLSAESAGPGRVRFTVTDTGVGFDDSDKSKIFGRFQQADGSITRRFGGTGLGLAISKNLAELMGGELDCQSRPDEGATFWCEVVLEAADIAPSNEVEATEAVDQDRPLRILLADDHPANRKVVQIMLAQTEIDLVMVEDGQQALDTFTTDAFDLVLMDMQMPVMDGLSATSAIRAVEKAEGRAHTPVLMLTANAMAEHVEAGRAAGADGHLAKPITMTSLFDAIQTALSRVETQRVLDAA